MLRILNFPSSSLLCVSADFPVSSCLLPENRIDKHCVRNQPKVWKQRGVNNSHPIVTQECALTSARRRLRKHNFNQQRKPYSRRKKPRILHMVPKLDGSIRFNPLLKP